MRNKLKVSELTQLVRGRVGRVTDCGVRGLGFKSRGQIHTSIEEKLVLFHEW